MSLFKADNLESLKEFKDTDYKLGILEREQPEGAGSFFQKLMKNEFSISFAPKIILSPGPWGYFD